MICLSWEVGMGPKNREVDMKTALVNAKIFDGVNLLKETTIVVDSGKITFVGTGIPKDAEVIDCQGKTLLPGLIDAHVHTSYESLGQALKFGVTTELEMQGIFTKQNRAGVENDDSVSDVRSSGFAITPPGGHPSELFPKDFRREHKGNGPAQKPLMPFSTTPEQAVAFVPQLILAGSDYIKFMVDDGAIEGHPGIPVLDRATLTAGVAEAHRHGMMTIAHALTLEATKLCLEAGIDGLAHVFMDRAHDQEIVNLMVKSGAFVVPCIVLNSSMMGATGAVFAQDPRVAGRLSPEWLATLQSCFGLYPQGKIQNVLSTVKALHDAGVDILTGTDVSSPLPFLGGLAHGASVHHELQFLVRAGLSPIEALRTATSVPARRFGLQDRGRIAQGLRADLLLVDGDPTTDIDDTLNISGVWRRGKRT